MNEKSLVKRLVVPLTDASTVTINPALAHEFTLSTGNSRTFGAPGTGYDGQKIFIAWKNTSGTTITITLTTGSAGSFAFLGSATGLASTPAGTTEYIMARYHATDDRWYVIAYSGYETVPVVVHSKSIGIESPTNAEDISIFYTDVAITITKMVAVHVGSSPSLTWTVRHSTDRSATGNEVVTGGTTTTSITTGSVVTSFNDATIPANSFVWLESTASSGVITSFNLTLLYTND